MSNASLRVGFLLALLLSAPPLMAQDAFPPRWAEVRATQPAALSFEISTPKPEYYLGEPIVVRLSFTSTQPKEFHAWTGSQDRDGFMSMGDEVLASPANQTEDPWRGLLEGGVVGSFLGGDAELSTTPFVSETLVNDWVRFLKPGQYRIAFLTRRVAQLAGTQRQPVQLASNTLTLNLVAPPADWVKTQIDQADPRTLRSLDTAESAIALARKLGSGDAGTRSVQMALLASSHRREVLSFLETRLTAPDQAVTHQFLDTLSQLAVLVASGTADSRSADETQRRGEARVQKRKAYSKRLVASLSSKQPDARVASMNTLLDAGNQERVYNSWLPATVASLITDFHALSGRTQSELLEGRWNEIRSPAMLPILHDLWEHPPAPGAAPPMQDVAVRRIYDLAPEDGRQIILAELHRPSSYLNYPTLAMLPDRYLPELNDVLAERQEKGQYVDNLILRYATGDIVQRVERGYVKRNAQLDRQNLPHCGGPLIYYFLQNDPAYGERELRAEMERPGGVPACYDIGFQFHTLDSKAWSPALEKLAIEFLSSPKVPVKRGAAEVLGKYGSADAQKPLWDTLQYFRDWWKGREAELNDENVQFERALRMALAQADSWKLAQDGYDRLLGLCSTDWCRQDVRDWMAKSSR